MRTTSSSRAHAEAYIAGSAEQYIEVAIEHRGAARYLASPDRALTCPHLAAGLVHSADVNRPVPDVAIPLLTLLGILRRTTLCARP